MNPLQRRLFRLQQPGMSRQPMGILASSPELMLAAQRGATQPLKMNQGGSVGQYMQTIQQLKQAGDKATLNNIATDQRLPRSIQMAAANALSGISGSSQAIPVMDDNPPVSDAERMAANRSNLAALRSAQGLGQGANVSMDLSPPPSAPMSDAERMAANRSNLAALRSAQGLGQGANVPIPTGSGIAATDVADDTRQNENIEALKNLRTAVAVRQGRDTALDPTLDPTSEFATSVGMLQDDPELENKPPAALGTRTQGEFGDEFGNIAPDRSMPSETLAATTSPPSKPQTGDDQTTGDGDKAGTTNAATQNAITKLQQNLTNLQTGSGGTAKLSPDQATNQSVLDDFSYETAQFISPEEVDLNKVDQAAKDLMGFDPKAAGEKKETAFWMGLMKAGLAMAAGESENAVTNIAKGLSYGLDSYGKDIALLNDQEREDRKEFRQLKVQMIKDERSFNIAQAGAQNTHNQHIADAKNRYTANRATLGIQEAKNIRDAEYQQANLALANAQLQNTIVKDIANLQIKGEELQLTRDTLQATIEKAQPQSLRIFKEVGYVDADGNVTQKGIDAYGSEAALVKAAVTGSSSASRETEGDRDAAALSRAIAARVAGQPISTDDLARLPKEFREDMTVFDDFIKQSGAQAASPAAPIIIANLPDPSVVAGKNPGDTIATKQGNYIVSSDGKSLIPTR